MNNAILFLIGVIFTGLFFYFVFIRDLMRQAKHEVKRNPDELVEPRWKILELQCKWSILSARKFEDAQHEQDPAGKLLIEHGAVCYQNCAAELVNLMRNSESSDRRITPAELELLDRYDFVVSSDGELLLVKDRRSSVVFRPHDE